MPDDAAPDRSQLRDTLAGQSARATRSPTTARGSCDPDRLSWARGLPCCGPPPAARCPHLTGRRRLPPPGRLAVVSARLGTALGGWALTDRRAGGSESRAGMSRRLRDRRRAPGPHLHQARPDHLQRRGPLPRRSWSSEFRLCRDQVPAESFDVGAPRRRGGPRPPARGGVLPRSSAGPARRGVDRPGPRGPAPSPARTCRGQGAAADHPPAGPVGPEGHGWLAPFLVGRIPIAALANPPALVELFAETITEELDFRLEAENMLDVAARLRRAGPARLRHRPSPPGAGDPAGAGHGAPVRVQLRRPGVHEGTPGIDTHEVIRIGMKGFTEGCIVHGIFHGDLHGGNLFVADGLTHRPAGLRHHRPDDRRCSAAPSCA